MVRDWDLRGVPIYCIKSNAFFGPGRNVPIATAAFFVVPILPTNFEAVCVSATVSLHRTTSCIATTWKIKSQFRSKSRGGVLRVSRAEFNHNFRSSFSLKHRKEKEERERKQVRDDDPGEGCNVIVWPIVLGLVL